MADLPELKASGEIALAYGVSNWTVASWARQGKLGPLVTSTAGYNTKALRIELDARLGALSDEVWAEARRHYQLGEHLRPVNRRGGAL